MKLDLKTQTVYVLLQNVQAYGCNIPSFEDIFQDEETANQICAIKNARNTTSDMYVVIHWEVNVLQQKQQAILH